MPITDLLSSVGASSNSGDANANALGDARSWLLPVQPPTVNNASAPPIGNQNPTLQNPILSVGDTGQAGLTPEQIGTNEDPYKHLADAQDHEDKAAVAYAKAAQSRNKAAEARRKVAAIQNPNPPSGNLSKKQAIEAGLTGALLGAAAGGGRFNRYIGNDVTNAAMNANRNQQEAEFAAAQNAVNQKRAMGQADVQSNLEDAAANAAQGNLLTTTQGKLDLQGLKNQGLIVKQNLANMGAGERNLHTVAGREFVAQLAQHGVEARALIGQLGNVAPEARGQLLQEAVGHPLDPGLAEGLALLSPADYLKYSQGDLASANANKIETLLPGQKEALDLKNVAQQITNQYLPKTLQEKINLMMAGENQKNASANRSNALAQGKGTGGVLDKQSAADTRAALSQMRMRASQLTNIIKGMDFQKMVNPNAPFDQNAYDNATRELKLLSDPMTLAQNAMKTHITNTYQKKLQEIQGLPKENQAAAKKLVDDWKASQLGAISGEAANP